MIPLIVSRHPGVVEWLSRRGVVGDVVAHATPADVLGRDVYGVLPLHLAAQAKAVFSVDLPNLRPEDRGRDLTPDEMDAAGAVIRGYVVRETRTPTPAGAVAGTSEE